MSAPAVSVVIVAWNAGESLAACIESVRESASEASTLVQFVVVDNASDDGAVDVAPLTDADVVVRNPLNAGYSVAAAQGMALSRAPWVLLLNPDVVVNRGFLRAMLDAVDASPAAVATLVPDLRFAGQREMVNCRGLTVDEIGIPAEIDAGLLATDPSEPSVPVLGGSSGCCLIRTRALLEVGGSEPVFFAYLEDADLALRLACSGYTARYVPDAVAFHVGSASTGATSPLKVFLVGRSRRLLFKLHGPHTVRASAWRVVVDVAHAAYLSLSTPFAPWSGRLEALRAWRYVAYLRRSRALDGPCRSAYERPPRAGLRETLRRKRRVTAGH